MIMQRLKKYLDRKGTPWRPIEEWSLIFKGNHPDGIFILTAVKPRPLGLGI